MALLIDPVSKIQGRPDLDANRKIIVGFKEFEIPNRGVNIEIEPKEQIVAFLNESGTHNTSFSFLSLWVGYTVNRQPLIFQRDFAHFVTHTKQFFL